MKDIESAGYEIVDTFWQTVIKAGNQALHSLLKESVNVNKKDIDNVWEALHQLEAFRHNIGFAGPQFCGKSSLINTLIGYPLMPTCNLATTYTLVELVYGKDISVIVKDEDKDGEIVFDKRCGDITKEEFKRLKTYACKVMEISLIENLQFFSDVFIVNEGLKPEQIKMDREDARQTALLILILFTVHVDFNWHSKNAREHELNMERQKMLDYFGVSTDVVNYRIVVQWNHPLLASGLIITDLPGMVSMINDKTVNGRIIKGTYTIVMEAMPGIDTMAFMLEPLVLSSAIPALKAMIANISAQNAVSVSDRIVAIMNKIDCICGEDQKRTVINRMLQMMRDAGADMTGKKVWKTSSRYGEHAYEGMDLSKSYFVQSEIYNLKDDGYDENEIQEEMPYLLKELEKGYQMSGIDELRDFFKTLVVREKCQKTFSVLDLLKDLVFKSTTPLRILTDMDRVDNDKVMEALYDLQSAAITPFRKIQKQIEEEIRQLQKSESELITQLINDVAAQYVDTWDVAVNSHIANLLNLSKKSGLTHMTMFGHLAYIELRFESEKLHVDLTAVRESYWKIVQHCSDNIERIYLQTVKKLTMIQKEYHYILKKCLDNYRGEEDSEIVALMEYIICILCRFLDDYLMCGFADNEMDAVGLNILEWKDKFQKVNDQIVSDIANNDKDFTKHWLHVMSEELYRTSRGLLTKIDDINVAISNLKLDERDKKILNEMCCKVGMEQILTPMSRWYESAEFNAKSAVNSLSINILNLLFEWNHKLSECAEGKGSEFTQSKQLLAKFTEIFDDMEKTVQPFVNSVVDLGLLFATD